MKKPSKVYTAGSNNEGHMLCLMLEESGIDAVLEEDHSNVSWSIFGQNQILQPNIWVAEEDTLKAAELIKQFEEERQRSSRNNNDGSTIKAECEDCGHVTTFPNSMKGTTQDCKKCGSFLDVGEQEWDSDFEETV